MVLFTNEFITEYRNDPGIKQMLNGIVLLNREEFFNWYATDLRKSLRKIVIPKKYNYGGVGTPTKEEGEIMEVEDEDIYERVTGKYQPPKQPRTVPASKASISKRQSQRIVRNPSKRRTAKASKPTKDIFRFIKESEQIKEKQYEELINIANKTFLEIASEVCSKSIGKAYGRLALKNIKEFYEFDFLVAVTPDYKKEPNVLNYEKQKIYKKKKILGFIIAERGECRKLPNTYSVNLICVHPVKVGSIEYKVKGTILLGAFLYCIKSYDGILEDVGGDELEVDQQGILELAGSYENLDGFFAYSKLGFRKDITLLDPGHDGKPCFHDTSLLQMVAPLDYFDSPKHIIQTVTGERRIPAEELIANDNTGLIQTGLPNTLPQTAEQKVLQVTIARNANEYYQKELDVHFNEGDSTTIPYMNTVMDELRKNIKRYLRLRAGLSEYSTDTEDTERSRFSEDSLEQYNSMTIPKGALLKKKSKQKTQSKIKSKSKSKSKSKKNYSVSLSMDL